MNRTFQGVFVRFNMDWSAKIFGSENARNLTDLCIVGAGLCPYHTDICKISRLSGASSLPLVSHRSLVNLSSLFINGAWLTRTYYYNYHTKPCVTCAYDMNKPLWHCQGTHIPRDTFGSSLSRLNTQFRMINVLYSQYTFLHTTCIRSLYMPKLSLAR